VEMPTILRGSDTAHMDDALSPPRPIPRKGKVMYEMWAKEDEWVQFRTTKHTGHVPSQISTLVLQLFLSSSAGKRKSKDTTGEAGNVDGGNELDAAAEAGPAAEPGIEVEAAAARDDELATPPPKSYPDRRRWCFRCTYKNYVEVDGQRTPKNMSRLDGSKLRKTST
jgi:hypothetical protein